VKRLSVPPALLAIGLITAGAAALRLVDLGAVRLDPFYDAAVRSMGLSWHNFFVGAYEPGGSVSIDKPPVDLWLQVVSVKLLGWGPVSLKLPQALAGTAAVPLLYGALRRIFGALAALTAAATLAVMPIEVITARSDTMDAVMMLLLVLALFGLVRACERQSRTWLLMSAAAMGLAFNVKLLESLVALPGLLTIAWLGRSRISGATPRGGAAVTTPDPTSTPSSQASARVPSGQLRSTVATAALAVAVYVMVALSWLLATLAFPPGERPWAIGSSDGSAWNAAFVFNGSERIAGRAVEVGAGTPIVPPSPTRLLAHSGQLPARWLGWLVLAALLLGAGALAAAWRRREARPVVWATTAGLFAWLLTGLVLFSAMARLHPRYVEGFTPAVAAMIGLGAGWLLSLRGQARLLLAPLVALLAALAVVSTSASVRAVHDHTSDAGDVGAIRTAEQRALSIYLRAHQGAARYEFAAGTATGVASLIVQDVQPVLMLTSYNGRPFTSVAELHRAVERGEVRYAVLQSGCGPRSSPTAAGCAPAARWVRAHGQDVSRQAGLPRGGLLWRLPVTSCPGDCPAR
jgi:4-amino-4-deoxy-L-arabinose transferase-like glycosyltransferase